MDCKIWIFNDIVILSIVEIFNVYFPIVYRDCVSKNIVWWWEEGVGLKNEGHRDGILHKDDLLSFILQKTGR